MNLPRIIVFTVLNLLMPMAGAAANINVSDAWARATTPGQSVGAAYMTLESQSDTTLVKVESPAADSVEMHSMTMNNGIMKMRMLDTLALSAGKPARLAPGGFHLMLFDLKKPLKAGDKVELTLHFKDKAGNTSTRAIVIPVKNSVG